MHVSRAFSTTVSSLWSTFICALHCFICSKEFDCSINHTALHLATCKWSLRRTYAMPPTPSTQLLGSGSAWPVHEWPTSIGVLLPSVATHYYCPVSPPTTTAQCRHPLLLPSVATHYYCPVSPPTTTAQCRHPLLLLPTIAIHCCCPALRCWCYKTNLTSLPLSEGLLYRCSQLASSQGFGSHLYNSQRQRITFQESTSNLNLLHLRAALFVGWMCRSPHLHQVRAIVCRRCLNCGI